MSGVGPGNCYPNELFIKEKKIYMERKREICVSSQTYASAQTLEVL